MFNPYLAIIIYIGLCLAIAFLGRNRKWGFWGYLWSSLFLTPLMGVMFLLASDPKNPK